MQNNNPSSMNAKMERYFSTLPPFIQESIKQSGTHFNTMEQMQSFVDHLNQKS